MADKKETKKEKVSSKGEMGIGTMLLILIIGLFIIWVLTGGATSSQNADKPFIKQTSTSVLR